MRLSWSGMTEHSALRFVELRLTALPSRQADRHAAGGSPESSATACTEFTMAEVAKSLTMNALLSEMDRPVVDRTGLAGRFDLTLDIFLPADRVWRRYPYIATLLGLPSLSK